MSAAPLFPPLRWAQRQDKVLVTVEIQDSKDVQLRLPKDGAVLSLSCRVDGAAGEPAKSYACELPLFRAVSPEESTFIARPRQVEIVLKKAAAEAEAEEAYWPRLTQEKTKNKHITIDWAHWKDEDEENEQEMDNLGDFGLGGGLGGDNEEFTQKMMQQFAVQAGKDDAAAEMPDGGAQAIPEFGSAKEQQSLPTENEVDEDMPPLEEDN